jgi:hypothetical protein
MDVLISTLQHHRVVSLELVGVLVLTTAAFSGVWLRQGLREGVTWLPGWVGTWLRSSRDDMPALYWFTIVGHAAMTAFLALAGIALLIWGATLIRL